MAMTTIFVLCISTGIVVMLQNTALSASEGSTLPICVELNDIAERIVTFALLATSGTATGLFGNA